MPQTWLKYCSSRESEILSHQELINIQFSWPVSLLILMFSILFLKRSKREVRDKSYSLQKSLLSYHLLFLTKVIELLEFLCFRSLVMDYVLIFNHMSSYAQYYHFIKLLPRKFVNALNTLYWEQSDPTDWLDNQLSQNTWSWNCVPITLLEEDMIKRNLARLNTE